MIGNNNNTKHPIGLPCADNVAPKAKMIGLNVAQSKESPTPAIGPINPDLTLVIVSSSIGAPFAFCSSMAIVIPLITDPNTASVL